MGQRGEPRTRRKRSQRDGRKPTFDTSRRRPLARRKLGRRERAGMLSSEPHRSAATHLGANPRRDHVLPPRAAPASRAEAASSTVPTPVTDRVPADRVFSASRSDPPIATRRSSSSSNLDPPTPRPRSNARPRQQPINEAAAITGDDAAMRQESSLAVFVRASQCSRVLALTTAASTKGVEHERDWC
jgi:hypothetical protein